MVTPDLNFVDAVYETFQSLTYKISAPQNRNLRPAASVFAMRRTRKKWIDFGDKSATTQSDACPMRVPEVSTQHTYQITAFPSFTSAFLPRIMMSLFSLLSVGIVTR